MPRYHNKSTLSNRRKYYSDCVKRQAVHDILVKHQTQTTVAKRLRCSVNSLSNWIKRFRHESESKPALPAFAPVHIVPAVSPDFIELRTSNGFLLRLPTTVSMPQLAELLLSLDRQC